MSKFGKRAVSLMLAVVLTAGMCACGTDKKEEKKENTIGGQVADYIGGKTDKITDDQAQAIGGVIDGVVDKIKDIDPKDVEDFIGNLGNLKDIDLSQFANGEL